MPLDLNRIQELSQTALRQRKFAPFLDIQCVSQDFDSVPVILDRCSTQNNVDLIIQLCDTELLDKFLHILSWPPAACKAYPLKIPESGFSLCHAVCVYLCGVPDLKKQFEDALLKTLKTNKDSNSLLYKRWNNNFGKENPVSNFAKQGQWEKLIQVPSSSTIVKGKIYSLCYFHIFVMANICRRAIIVITDQNLEPNNFPSSVFLPLLLPDDEVIKCPIYILYVSVLERFFPLVFGVTDIESDTSNILMPVMDSDFKQFQVPFLLDNENSMEMLNKFIFMSKIGHTTPLGIQEVLAAKVPSLELSKCLWEPGPNPNTLIKECYKLIENGGTADEGGAVWIHVISLFRTINHQENNLDESSSGIYQPHGDDDDEIFEDAEDYPSHTTDAVSRKYLKHTTDAAASRVPNPNILTNNKPLSESATGRIEEINEDDSSDFVSTQNQSHPSSSGDLRSNDASSNSQAININNGIEKLTKVLKIGNVKGHHSGVTSNRIVNADPDSTYPKFESTNADTDVASVRNNTSKGSAQDLESDNSSFGVIAGSVGNQPSYHSDNYVTAGEAVCIPEPKATPSAQRSEHHTATTSETVPQSTSAEETSAGNVSGRFLQISDSEISIKRLSLLVENVLKFNLKCARPTEASSTTSDTMEEVHCELVKQGSKIWALNIKSQPRVIPHYIQTNADVILAKLECVDGDITTLRVTAPTYVFIREKGRGPDWDYAVYNMLDVEEYEDSTQVSPFSDPRKCRTAGCMNLGSPLNSNFCQGCFANLPLEIRRVTNKNLLSKCKNSDCDNTSDLSCRGYCYRCYHQPGF